VNEGMLLRIAERTGITRFKRTTLPASQQIRASASSPWCRTPIGGLNDEPSPPSVIFHPTNGVDETAVAQVQADLRRRILRSFVGRGLLESNDAKDMLTYQHSGFSVDAGLKTGNGQF